MFPKSNIDCQILEQFPLSVVKTKPLLSLKPIKDTDSQMNQSKLEVHVNTSSWHEAQENVFERVKVGFGIISGWMKQWYEFLKPSL